MTSLRTLRDNLVAAEKWTLAIDISLKCGLQKTGIMAAWGIALIKAGCFETGKKISSQINTSIHLSFPKTLINNNF